MRRQRRKNAQSRPFVNDALQPLIGESSRRAFGIVLITRHGGAPNTSKEQMHWRSDRRQTERPSTMAKSADRLRRESPIRRQCKMRPRITGEAETFFARRTVQARRKPATTPGASRPKRVRIHI